MKRIISLTESKLKRIIYASIRNVLKESQIGDSAEDVGQQQDVQRTLFHNDIEQLRNIFKYAYKCAYNINKRYEIQFERDKRTWDEIFGGGARLELYYDKGGRRKSCIGWITIKEINYDNFRNRTWLKDKSHTDGKYKLAVDGTVNGRSPSIDIVIDRDQLEEYVKDIIYQMDSVNRNCWSNYRDDNGYYSIFNDNILNVLANRIH